MDFNQKKTFADGQYITLGAYIVTKLVALKRPILPLVERYGFDMTYPMSIDLSKYIQRNGPLDIESHLWKCTILGYLLLLLHPPVVAETDGRILNTLLAVLRRDDIPLHRYLITSKEFQVTKKNYCFGIFAVYRRGEPPSIVRLDINFLFSTIMAKNRNNDPLYEVLESLGKKGLPLTSYVEIDASKFPRLAGMTNDYLSTHVYSKKSPQSPRSL